MKRNMDKLLLPFQMKPANFKQCQNNSNSFQICSQNIYSCLKTDKQFYKQKVSQY